MAVKVVVDLVIPGSIIESRTNSRKNSKSLNNNVWTIDAHQSWQFIADEMLATPNGFIKPNRWKNMSRRQRIASYLDDIAHDRGAKSYTFEILED